MAFEKPEYKDKKQMELANQLNGLLLRNDVSVVEGAIRFMAANTRNTLLRALEMAEKNSPGVTKIENSL